MKMVTIPAKAAVTFELRSDDRPISRHRRALHDVREAAGLVRLAVTLGWLDIRLRYRGSVLGPLWLTLSTTLMIAALGYLYAGIFHTPVHDYLPFLALSLVLWGFMSSIVSEACTTFTEAEGIIRSTRMPFTLFAIRVLVRNVLVLAHNAVVIIAVYVIFGLWPGWIVVLAAPGLLIWTANAFALILLLGSFCARFRDIQPIVNNVMQIAFFVTPVIWKPEQLGRRAHLLPLNPFFDILDIVRAPLLGQAATFYVWAGAILASFALWALAWAFFVRARGRIAFWI